MRTMSGSPCQHYDCSNRNSFGYCKTTVCINEHYQQEQWGSQSTTNKSESAVIKQQTNADRIRAMTDEELAEFMIEGCYDRECPDILFPADTPFPKDASNERCRKCWLDWLKQGVKSNG